MKQFIVLLGIMPLIIIFIMQMSVDQINNHTINAVQSCTYTAKEQAKQEGSFSQKIKEELITDISRKTGITKDKIRVYGDEDIKLRYNTGDDRIIKYRVEVEIDKIMAGNKFLGISDSENSFTYVIDSYTASERV